jgi:hypothetical protein
MENIMPNQPTSKRILRNSKRFAPGTQNFCLKGRRSLWSCASLSLLAGSLVILGITTQAQDLTKKQEQIASQQSGFLRSYGQLQPDSKNPDLLIYVRNPNDLKTSTKFIIDPVVVYLLPQAEERAIDPADLAQLAQTFTQAIKDELTASGEYEVVTDPGPGVVELRVALTNVEPTGGKKNAALKGATTAASLTVAPGASLVVPRLSVGKVAIEGEILDSTSGQVQVSFMTSKAGRRYFTGLKQYQTWGDINAAFKSWAKGFRNRLDEAHES